MGLCIKVPIFLLRYNTHIMKLTPLQPLAVHPQSCATITLIPHFHHPERNPLHFSCDSPFLHTNYSQPPATANLLSTSTDVKSSGSLLFWFLTFEKVKYLSLGQAHNMHLISVICVCVWMDR